ncbi:MAG: glycosyltransferase, partial [Candidatus Parvarchaeota archaeon]
EAFSSRGQGGKRNSNVQFLGFVDEEKLSELLSRSHLLLFPSMMENASMVKAEALRYGLPVVYRKTPFNSDLERNEYCQGAVTDDEFLKAINQFYLSFKKDPSDYYRRMEKISETVPSFSKYIESLSLYLTGEADGFQAFRGTQSLPT